jgi:hypothetical protein
MTASCCGYLFKSFFRVSSLQMLQIPSAVGSYLAPDVLPSCSEVADNNDVNDNGKREQFHIAILDSPSRRRGCSDYAAVGILLQQL